MIFSSMALLAKTAELTLTQKGIASAKVVLTGFVVVFSMLLLLILIIKVYSMIVVKAQNSGKNKKEKILIKENASFTPAPVKANVPPVQEDGASEEVIAVISAAVATMYGSESKVKIKSIKKSNDGRCAWAKAGLLDNTRPF